MSHLYGKFEKHLCKGNKILDLGCGAGRDTKHFLDSGYDVVSVDGSIEMIKHCRSYFENEIHHSGF